MISCKGRCHKIVGYEKGSYHYVLEGKKFCKYCDYKIITNLQRCTCCHGNYRNVPQKSQSRKQLKIRQAREFQVIELTINTRLTN